MSGPIRQKPRPYCPQRKVCAPVTDSGTVLVVEPAKDRGTVLVVEPHPTKAPSLLSAAGGGNIRQRGDNMEYLSGQFDIAVIGAGHAGCEAALAAARL
ncbi:MAG: FAD-dependent oxidoreductase, partial [Roseburia sp.]|nr:FAD-dependent oxidoreductase [Roseburia sp.]